MIQEHRLVRILVSLGAVAAVLIGCATPRPAPEPSLSSSQSPSESPTPIDTVHNMVSDTKLEVSVAMITASPQRRASIAERILETAVVDGVLYYVILGSRTTQQVESGIPQAQIIGLLREPTLGLVEGNLVRNRLFLERIFTAAAQTVSEDMVAEMKRFETKAIALFDQRVRV